MPEYTLLAVLSVLVVVALERWRWRTGLFRQTRYWAALAIVVFFQVLVDGYLTKIPGTIVHYAPEQITGLRIGWDSPIEDFAFGFSMVTAVMARWTMLRTRADRADGADGTDQADRAVAEGTSQAEPAGSDPAGRDTTTHGPERP